MRLAEEKIKAAILGPYPEGRQRAVHYFADAFSEDPSVMPLVIQAVERDNDDDHSLLLGLARNLAQTPETVEWAIKELQEKRANRDPQYARKISAILAAADPSLLLSREADILDSPNFASHLREPLSERLELLSCDTETCWSELENVCEEGKEAQYVQDVDWSYAGRLVEALARDAEQCEEKVHQLLSQHIDDFHSNPMKWLEPLAVRLAGQARLNSAIPLIIDKLMEDGGDLLNEECAEALTRIGTPEVIEAVAEVYPDAPNHFRIYARSPLEDIHSDLAVEKCLELLRQEQDAHIRCFLAEALLVQFADEGIEESRQLLLKEEPDFTTRGLRTLLLEHCKITGQRFPEFEQWEADREAEQQEHRKRLKELEDDPQGLMQFALEKLTGEESIDLTEPEEEETDWAPHDSPPRLEPVHKVGRNDPCPCGSGKKFKKCCLKK